MVLPLAGPGLGASAAMVFISVVTELNATLLLSPIDTQTLATQVWADTSTMAFAAAPYAALLTGISLCASGVLFALLGKSARSASAAECPPNRPPNASKHTHTQAHHLDLT